jgi:hypothetical protein
MKQQVSDVCLKGARPIETFVNSKSLSHQLTYYSIALTMICTRDGIWDQPRRDTACGENTS